MYAIRNLVYRHILDIPRMTLSGTGVTCIIGESGSGKTTFLRMLNRMLSPDSGIVEFRGSALESYDPVHLRRKVVMLPQHPVVFPGDIRSNLQIGRLFSHRDAADDEALREVLRSVNLDSALDSDASVLSGGEKQRLAIARIVLMDPDVYLLDEPSSALDDGTEDVVIRSVSEQVRRHGRALIMVTHSRRIADQFADDVVELEKRR